MPPQNVARTLVVVFTTRNEVVRVPVPSLYRGSGVVGLVDSGPFPLAISALLPDLIPPGPARIFSYY